MKILGIESSCDETAAAVVEDGRKVLSNIIATSLEEHKLYGGVVPEIASRRHAECISSVVREALEEAECTLVCRKLFTQRLAMENIPADVVNTYYVGDAPHDIYIGEVVEILRQPADRN